MIPASIMLAALFGCSSSPETQFDEPAPPIEQIEVPPAVIPPQLSTKASLMQVYKTWEGAPYRLGGSSFNGIDCSAFVQVAYRDALDMELPRTTYMQSKMGKQVKYKEIRVGDLAFFKTTRTMRHVGVYIGNKQFMHASTSQGVMISRLDNPYWASKFWHFRRVISPPESNLPSS
ncbi:NlpC/P60 family protein [Vibrio japonicus]|uniref:NlpC/P60 family protein n=1 Tax=Vibrio japonicus TaxID=1824638 RepID=A0ABY5LLQ3_9VIBR|nr:NlpC/P60 family protein [Vibrio japonicus]UUM31830.1 NlpC/P60 family protein [Vibrio japonicus]